MKATRFYIEIVEKALYSFRLCIQCESRRWKAIPIATIRILDAPSLLYSSAGVQGYRLYTTTLSQYTQLEYIHMYT